MSDAKPDWENFSKAVLADWPTGDLEGSVLFELSLQYGMIKEVPGGYNSDHHFDNDGICPEEGDPWYEYTFGGEAGPGLYSIAEMKNTIAALTAQNREMALDVLASSGQAQEAYAAQLAAEAEAAALRAKVARLEGERDDALTFLDNAVSKSPQPLKDLGAYLASLLDEDQWPQAERYLNAAVKSFAALTDGGKDE